MRKKIKQQKEFEEKPERSSSLLEFLFMAIALGLLVLITGALVDWDFNPIIHHIFS
ncbi:hypothetical protein N9I75_00355 [Alphaproteobacteria bacterium]|nr:hypothetical protein [Alphaproteobacteria bacterium]